MERRLASQSALLQLMVLAIDGPAMSKLRILVAAASILASSSPIPVFAQDGVGTGTSTGVSAFRRIIWYFDGRDDTRDFPTNGFFPGDFAANPAGAAIGAAGIFGSNPQRPIDYYPAPIVGGSQRDQAYCIRRYRSYDPASGTFVGRDHVRHPC
jgi:hypothetical protein